jgi:molybdopterin converting factor small subunit
VAVTIRVPALWRPAAGGAGQVELPAGNLTDVLGALIEQFPALGAHLLDERGEVRASINLFVNMEHVRFRGGLAAPLRDGDEVYIVPMITGGGR